MLVFNLKGNTIIGCYIETYSDKKGWITQLQLQLEGSSPSFSNCNCVIQPPEQSGSSLQRGLFLKLFYFEGGAALGSLPQLPSTFDFTKNTQVGGRGSNKEILGLSKFPMRVNTSKEMHAVLSIIFDTSILS